MGLRIVVHVNDEIQVTAHRPKQCAPFYVVALPDASVRLETQVRESDGLCQVYLSHDAAEDFIAALRTAMDALADEPNATEVRAERRLQEERDGER